MLIAGFGRYFQTCVDTASSVELGVVWFLHAISMAILPRVAVVDDWAHVLCIA